MEFFENSGLLIICTYLHTYKSRYMQGVHERGKFTVKCYLLYNKNKYNYSNFNSEKGCNLECQDILIYRPVIFKWSLVAGTCKIENSIHNLM